MHYVVKDGNIAIVMGNCTLRLLDSSPTRHFAYCLDSSPTDCPFCLQDCQKKIWCV